MKRISPLALSNLLRDAFMSGAGIHPYTRIPEDVQERWLTYSPEGAVLDRYEEIQQAIEEHNNEVIKVQRDT